MEITKTTATGIGQNLHTRIEAPGWMFEIEHGCHKRVNDHSWWLTARKVGENHRPRHDCVLARLPTKKGADVHLRGLLNYPELLATDYDKAHEYALQQDRRQEVVAWAQRNARDRPQALLDIVRAAVAADPSLAEKLYPLPPEETP